MRNVSSNASHAYLRRVRLHELLHSGEQRLLGLAEFAALVQLLELVWEMCDVMCM